MGMHTNTRAYTDWCVKIAEVCIQNNVEAFFWNVSKKYNAYSSQKLTTARNLFVSFCNCPFTETDKYVNIVRSLDLFVSELSP